MTTPASELTLTRTIHAPRARVFKAWIEQHQLAQWWGPRGFTNPVCEIDVHPGGAIRIDMKGPDGTIYPMTGTFHEIREPERLVFMSAALDQQGNPLFEVLNTITFMENEGMTTLVMHAVVSKIRPEAAPYLAGQEVGWSQTIDRLDAFVVAR